MKQKSTKCVWGDFWYDKVVYPKQAHVLKLLHPLRWFLGLGQGFHQWVLLIKAWLLVKVLWEWLGENRSKGDTQDSCPPWVILAKSGIPSSAICSIPIQRAASLNCLFAWIRERVLVVVNFTLFIDISWIEVVVLLHRLTAYTYFTD